MSYALNNIATTDSYPVSGGASLSTRGAVRANISISNNAVFFRPTFRDLDGTTTVGAEIFMPPGFYSLSRRLDKLEFRSGATSMVARVSVEALTQAEV